MFWIPAPRILSRMCELSRSLTYRYVERPYSISIQPPFHPRGDQKRQIATRTREQPRWLRNRQYYRENSPGSRLAEAFRECQKRSLPARTPAGPATTDRESAARLRPEEHPSYKRGH